MHEAALGFGFGEQKQRADLFWCVTNMKSGDTRVYIASPALSHNDVCPYTQGNPSAATQLRGDLRKYFRIGQYSE